MDKKSLLILSELRKDARISLTSMSRKTNIPVSTIYEKIRSHECIERHTALLNFAKLGYPARANILIKSGRDSRDKLMDFLISHPSINSMQRLHKEFDLMIEAVFRNMHELELFREKIESDFRPESMKLHMIIEDIKKEGFLTQDI